MAQLACSMVKAINATSSAIHGINQKLSQVREAVLENREAINYLLLQHTTIMRNLKECVVLTFLTILN